MTDSNHSNQDDPTRSGAHKVVTPKTGPVTTKIDVQEGTREHTVMVEQVPAGSEEHHGHHDRRKSGMQVNVGQMTGGLAGGLAQYANLTAVGLIMAMFVWVIFSGRADTREYMSQMREDRISERSQDQAANAAIIGAVTSLAGKIDARDVKLETAIEEARLARAEVRVALAEQRQLHQEMISVLKSIRDKGGPSPEEAVAPMPRKVSGAG